MALVWLPVLMLSTLAGVPAIAVVSQAAPALPQVRDPRQSDILRIQQLDVGQGDAALISTPEGRRVLIDAGPDSRAVSRLLRRQGVDTIDLVIASHNHADHIGGMPGVLASFAVRAYMDNGMLHPTSIYRRTIATVERKRGLQYLSATERTISLGSLRVSILPPVRLDETQNNNSVGVLLEYGAFRALYTGDSEQPELRAWLRAGRIQRVTLLKAAHHGSWNGTTPEFRRLSAPRLVLISVGAGNQYGHPSQRVVREWLSGGAKVYRTDQDGTIEISVLPDGQFTVSTAARRNAGRAQ